MLNKQVKLKTLVAALKKLGFVERQTAASHGIFSLPESGLVVTLYMGEKDVPVVYLKAILRQIVDRGIMAEEDFLELLK